MSLCWVLSPLLPTGSARLLPRVENQCESIAARCAAGRIKVATPGSGAVSARVTSVSAQRRRRSSRTRSVRMLGRDDDSTEEGTWEGEDATTGSAPTAVVAGVSVLATMVGLLLFQYPVPHSLTEVVKGGVGIVTLSAAAVIIANSKGSPTKKRKSRSKAEKDPVRRDPPSTGNTRIEDLTAVGTGARSNAPGEVQKEPEKATSENGVPTANQAAEEARSHNFGTLEAATAASTTEIGNVADVEHTSKSATTASEEPIVVIAETGNDTTKENAEMQARGDVDGTAIEPTKEDAEIVSGNGTFAAGRAKETVGEMSPADGTETGATSPSGKKSRSLIKIKVFGVGGGGGNAVNRMMQQEGIEGIDFCIMNTDVQALVKTDAEKVVLGMALTRGLGAGGVPSVGRGSAEESTEDIAKAMEGADMVFITAGMGGGTGSGAAPVVAQVAKEMGILTVGVVTKPFSFEGRRRETQANKAIETLRNAVDTLLVVSNDRLLSYVPETMPLQSAFSIADDVLRQGIVGLSQIVIQPGLVNVDFADVRATMLDAGTALMGIGRASGEGRAIAAAQSAITSPLLDYSISRARGVVFNITGGPSMSLQEVNAAAEVIYNVVGDDANIIFGALVDESAGDEISMTVVATGVEDPVPIGPSAHANATEAAPADSAPADQNTVHQDTRQETSASISANQ